MIKIILNGCNGKMGKVISNSICNFPNLQIVAGVDKNDTESLDYPLFKNINDSNINCDVVLDFSRAEALPSLLNYCKTKKLPLILCTTGYSEKQIEEFKNASKEIPVFNSSNMSIGINVLNNILKDISAFLYENYDIEIIEKHHNQKVDAPSGTALLLGNTIKSSINEDTNFTYGRSGSCKREKKEIGIHAIRGGGIVGEHQILFAGSGEIIELKHTAISREVFAIGALKACEFMYGKHSGFYSMNNVINNK